MTVTLITGCSTGIGRATAIQLARAGHRVFASMRNTDAGSELKQQADDEKLDLELIRLDIDDPDSVQEAVGAVASRAGRVDVLVNNAGVGGGGSVEETPEELWRSIMETNFFGALRMTRAVLPGMRQRRQGAIVNVSSAAGRLAVSPQGAYTASKFALEAMSEVLAQEVLRFNIRVAIIEPGVILTPIFGKNASEPDLNSPYVDFALRIGRMFASRLEDPSPPELVAEAIEHALTTDEPRLRYPVGEDAHQFIDGRREMSDEEWVAYGREMSDEEVAGFYKQHFKMDI